MLTSLRLFTRAPSTRMRSWLSATVTALAKLLDAEQVAGRVAEGAVADAVGLVGRLLHDLGVTRLEAFERAVQVIRGEVDAREGALGHHLGDRALLLLGDAGRGGGRIQHDRGAGLAGRTDG